MYYGGSNLKHKCRLTEMYGGGNLINKCRLLTEYKYIYKCRLLAENIYKPGVPHARLQDTTTVALAYAREITGGPTPPAGSRQSCQPRVKLHILP